MRLLVTGGLGFVGRNFVRFVLEHYQPEFVTSVDADAATGNAENRGVIPPADAGRHEFFRADVTDPEAMRAILRRHKYFALIHGAGSPEQPAPALASLLDLAREAGVKRFVLPLPDRDDATCNSLADLLAAATDGPETLLLRAPAAYGPFQHPRHRVARIITQILRGKSPTTSPAAASPLIHIEDLCSAIVAVMLEGQPGATYTAEGSAPLDDATIAAIVRDALREPGAPTATPAEESALDAANPLRRELGWRPIHAAAPGLADTARWYHAHPDWWGPLLSP